MPGRAGIYWRHGRHVLQDKGPIALARLIWRKLQRLLGHYHPGYFDFGYESWRRRHAGDEIAGELTDRPLVSVLLPVYNTAADHLNAAIDSVAAQTYENWQLCIVNDASTAAHVQGLLEHAADGDARIRLRHLAENRGIAGASAAALGLAEGEWVALLDHDDCLAPSALKEMLLVAAGQPDADLLYSDEDKLDGTRHCAPFFKPDWSPELLACQNYLGHLLLVRRKLVEEAGGFHPGYDGAQDYDLVLRATRLARKVVHVPRILYHWRQIPGSTSLLFGEKDYAWESGRRALDSALVRDFPGARAEKGSVPGTYRPIRPVHGNPVVSVIIPFRDRADLLDRCLGALLDHGGWPDLEIIGVDNQSIDSATRECKTKWADLDSRVRFIAYDEAFNFAAICNHGVGSASGDYLLFLNNDVEISIDGSVHELLQYASQPAIGAVGGRLTYPDGSIQHAGIVVGIGGSAGHAFKGFPGDLPGYFARLQVASNVSAVTAAMLMVDRRKFDEVGGFDADRFAIALNDVDFCLELMRAGYRNVISPWAGGVHHESASRGSDLDRAGRRRLSSETRRFREKWQAFLGAGDPCYHPALSLESEDYRIALS